MGSIREGLRGPDAVKSPAVAKSKAGGESRQAWQPPEPAAVSAIIAARSGHQAMRADLDRRHREGTVGIEAGRIGFGTGDPRPPLGATVGPSSKTSS